MTTHLAGGRLSLDAQAATAVTGEFTAVTTSQDSTGPMHVRLEPGSTRDDNEAEVTLKPHAGACRDDGHPCG